MKKLIRNPEYDKAPHSIGWLQGMRLGPNPNPLRFREPLPIGIWDRIGAFEEWIKANAVPEMIEVDE